VVLHSGPKVATAWNHRVVAESFLGPRPAGMVVNHRNGKRDDNRIENLEYVTSSANTSHSFRDGGGKGRRKITEDQVRAIRADSRPLYEVCYEHKLLEQQVRNIKSRRSWGWVSDQPEPRLIESPQADENDIHYDDWALVTEAA
jgi:hypothetical protein